ncbi:MAG: cyclic nucleotide-binding domain-containing protein [Actinomycetota bacterium]|nr:cyclic nucleotide-binding domain-containing protein [Actinomycetota bacterium]
MSLTFLQCGMRIESAVTALSWIPSEAIGGMTKLPFEMGVSHYDPPPPDAIDDLDTLRQAGRFRFANELRAWIDVDDGGSVAAWGHAGRGHISSTTLQVGPKAVAFAAVAFPDLQPDVEVSEHGVRFVQTSGGRTGVPAPRRVKHPPFVQIVAPLAWSTLALTIRADGTSDWEMLGASPFPRHWIYDHTGALAAKTGMIDFTEWYRTAFGKHTPWGDEDSPALVTVAESALERELSARIMTAGARPTVRPLGEGATLVEQGDAGDSLFVLLDGVLAVEVDGQALAEVGPGAVLGERAVLEGGTRTATLRAVTPAKVAVAAADLIDLEALAELSEGHRREAG